MPRSLRSRTVIFLVAIFAAVCTGALIFNTLQDRLTRISEGMRLSLTPTRRIVEQAVSELDLQIHDLEALQAAKSLPPGFARPGPAIRTLEGLHASTYFPHFLKNSHDYWLEALSAYRNHAELSPPPSDLLREATELRRKTLLLSRAVDREMNVQLLSLTETIRKYSILWNMALAVLFVAMFVFVLLLWRWLLPLQRLQHWFAQHSSGTDFIPPQPAVGSGITAPPVEIQELSKSVSSFLHTFVNQAKELSGREEKLKDIEASMNTLFAALQHLLRHNEELFEELLKKEKLASMSEMAAQLAHEIRNPLNSMNLKLEMLREDLKSPEDIKVLDTVLHEIDRLDALTESHLRSTKAHLLQKVGDDSSSLLSGLEDTLKFLEAEIQSRGIQIELQVSDEKIAIPENVLRAVLVNLLKNSWEAMENADHWKILIRSRHTDSRFDLEIYDTGSGLPDELLGQSPRSFFTTKKEGSGLGLVTSLKMLSSYGATLNFQQAKNPYSSLVKITGPVTKIKPLLEVHA